jgi:methanogenic corrinoid protein MtbC1
VILVTTPAGQLIELGALLVAASAAAEGWGVVYLGADLPAADIAKAAAQLGARAVAISIVHATRDPALRDELEALAKALKGKRSLIVGGRASPPYALRLRRLGAVLPDDLAAFRVWLHEHATARGRAT